MAMNPYEVLGVPEDASQEEVKKAYRKKARENHPDLNPDDPGAAERMNKVNEAYDRIMNPEKYARERVTQPGGAGPFSGQPGQGGYTYTSGTGPYGWTTTTFTWEDIFGSDWANMGANSPNDIHPEVSPTDSAEVRTAINAMNSGNYLQAVTILANVANKDRNARWYYLSALANHGVGNTSLGYEQIRKAVQMDPGNISYQQALNAFQRPGQTYTQESQERGYSAGMSNCCWNTCCCMAWAPLCCGGSIPLICCC